MLGAVLAQFRLEHEAAGGGVLRTGLQALQHLGQLAVAAADDHRLRTEAARHLDEHHRLVFHRLDSLGGHNDGGIGLSRTAFPTVWFKGGSEPGVVTLNYLARDRSGALFTASLMLSDPTEPLDESTVDPAALALLRGAFQLA